MNTNVKQRQNWIDFVKCLAIVIVLMNHALLNVPIVSFWGGMFYVPVFFVLSGYTFHLKKEKVVNMLERRAKRLLLPYFLTSGLLWLFFVVKENLIQKEPLTNTFQNLFGIFYARNQVLLSSVIASLDPKTADTMYVMKILNSPMWFLPALFVTLVIYDLFERVSDNNEQRKGFMIAVLVLVAVVFHYFAPLLLPWSLDSVPFFLLLVYGGDLLKRKKVLDKRNAIWGVLILLALHIVFARINGSTNFSIGEYGKSITLSIYNAFASSVVCIYVCKKLGDLSTKFEVLGDKTEGPNTKLKNILRPFYAVGRSTLFILCWHMFVFSLLDTAFAVICSGVVGNTQKVVKVILTIVILTVISVYCEKWKSQKEKNPSSGEKLVIEQKSGEDRSTAIEMK